MDRLKHFKFIWIILFSFGGIIYFNIFLSSGLTEPPLPGSNFQICTGVTNVFCANLTPIIEAPAVTLNWNYPILTGTQSAYRIQIDNNSDYLTPEVNTGWISDSAARSYTSIAGALNDNTQYWWRIEVRDSFATESGWTCGDSTFTTLVCSPPDEDCGLRGYDGATILHFACEPLGTVTSPLRIRAGDNNNYGVVLVDPSDPDASKFRIRTSAGVKALKIYSAPAPPPPNICTFDSSQYGSCEFGAP